MTDINSVPLRYRLFQPGDLPSVLRLWEEETEWGSPPHGEWEKWTKTPDHPLLIVVAVDESDEVVGQMSFLPMPMQVGDRVMRGYRPFAPILSSRVRGTVRSPSPLDQPAVAMYTFGGRLMREHNADLMYMLPDPRWVRLLRMFPNLMMGSFPLWSLPLPLASSLPLGDGFRAEPLSISDDRVNQLWREASRLYRCQVVKDQGGLERKLIGPGISILGVTHGSRLVGLVASAQKGDRQWLICDMLTADSQNCLHATIAAACNGADQELRKVAVLATPLMQPVLRQLGFERDKWDFPLIVARLNDSLDREAIAPDGWYLSGID